MNNNRHLKYSPTDEKLDGDYKKDQYDEFMSASTSSSSSSSSKCCDPLYDRGESSEESEMSPNEYSHDNGSQLNNDEPYDDLQDSLSARSERNDDVDGVEFIRKISDESSTVNNDEGEETPRNENDLPSEVHLTENLH